MRSAAQGMKGCGQLLGAGIRYDGVESPMSCQKAFSFTAEHDGQL